MHVWHLDVNRGGCVNVGVLGDNGTTGKSRAAHLHELHGVPSIVQILVERFPQKVVEFRRPLQNEHKTISLQAQYKSAHSRASSSLNLALT